MDFERENIDIDREQEAHGYENAQPQPSFDLVVAKESILPTVQGFIDTLIQGVDSGEINALEVFATFKKLEKIFDASKRTIEDSAMLEAQKYDKTFKISGINFTFSEGRKMLQYNEDWKCQSLTLELKERQNLVTLATKSKEAIYDSEGVEVTKVSIKPSKSSLAVKF